MPERRRLCAGKSSLLSLRLSALAIKNKTPRRKAAKAHRPEHPSAAELALLSTPALRDAPSAHRKTRSAATCCNLKSVIRYQANRDGVAWRVGFDPDPMETPWKASLHHVDAVEGVPRFVG